MRKFLSSSLSISMIATSLAGFTPAHAQTAQGLEDMIGMRGSSTDSELERRGYSFVKNQGIAQMWWNASTRRCVSLAVDDGRVQSVQSTSAADCNQQQASSGNDKNDNLTGILVGAAAIGLVAALASHHKRSNDTKNNQGYNSEYERGYNDAMYSGHYAQNDSEAYHSGYMAGEAERNNRKAANTPIVRGAPAEAQRACARRGDEQFSVPAGSTVPVSVYDYGQGNYEVTVASGHQRANCSVNANGRISDFLRL